MVRVLFHRYHVPANVEGVSMIWGSNVKNSIVNPSSYRPDNIEKTQNDTSS